MIILHLVIFIQIFYLSKTNSTNYFDIQSHGLMSFYNATLKTTGNGDSNYNHLKGYGAFTFYNSIFYGNGENKCGVECNTGTACYGMYYICNPYATCEIYKCNSTQGILLSNYDCATTINV